MHCRIILLHGPIPLHWSADAVARALTTLPYARRLELERRDPRARLASLAGARLAVAGLRRLRGESVQEPQFEYAQDRKPRIRGGPHFSVSHSGARVACAICESADVGLDLEVEDGRRDRAWLEHWTAVEATLKAAGRGLRDSREVRVRVDGAWCGPQWYWTRRLDLAPYTVATLASAVAPGDVETVALASIDP